jgi:hypothetical protein
VHFRGSWGEPLAAEKCFLLKPTPTIKRAIYASNNYVTEFKFMEQQVFINK